ncbi:MAG: hypothetical protein ACO3P5_01770 [Steroidobacteraceae bacterium]
MNFRILPASLARLLGLSLTLLWLSACLSSAAPKAPTITEQPKDRTGFVTQAVKFDLGVSGKPPFSFQWFRDGVAIAGATDPTYVTPALTLEDDGSKYSVSISNADGSVKSSEATLTVKPGPTVTGQPSSQSVALGASASFTVTASGEQLVYQWYRDELPISGANAATYTISATTAADDGAVLRAYAINPGGFAVSQAATLTVSAAPAITIQPVSQTLVAGDPLLLGVSATGGNLQYQWQRNGVDISGATSRVLRLEAISSDDNAATFSVIVRNAQGAVTSANATVTVISADPLELPKAAADVAVSDTGVLTGGFVLVRRSNGSVASWGHAVDGQRGDGTAGEATDTISTVKLPTGRTAKAVAAGGSHAMALLDDGSVVTWGVNDSGQLGLGDTATRATPTKVTLDRPAIAIAAGRLFSVAVLDDGRVFTWGANTIGQLGDDGRIAQPVPVQAKDIADVVEVAAGSEHVIALKRDGSVWAWGANAAGQLGDGSFKASRVPVATGLRAIARVRAGGNQSFAISSRRGVYSFGESGDGQLGLGDAVSTDIGVPTVVARSVIDAAANDRIALLLGANGLVSSAGANESGSLGDGGTTARKIFGAVNVLSNVVALDSGGRSFSVAIVADGTTYVWGDNTTKHFANSAIAAAGTGTPTAVPNFDAIP